MVEKNISRIASIALFTLSGICSSFFFSGEYDISYAPSLIFLGIALCISWKQKQTVSIPVHTSIYGLFLLVAMGSFFWSNAPYISLVSIIVATIVPIGYLLTRLFFSEHKSLSYTPIITVISIGLCFSFYGIFYMVQHNELRLSSVFSNPNTFSALLVLCCIPAFLFFMNAKSSKKHILWGLISALFITTLVLTGSRSGLLTTIITTSLLLWLVPHPKKRQYIIGIIGLYAVIAVIAIWHDMQFFNRILDTFSQSYTDSTQGRLNIWSGSWDLAKEHIFYGTGFGTFFLNYPPYRIPFDPSVGQWAHWDGLQILTELGIFGATLWYGFWAMLAASIYTNRKTLSDTAIIGGIGCLAIFIQSHITYLYLILPLLCVMGIYLAHYDHHLTNVKTLTLKRTPTFIAIFCILCLTVQSALSMWASQQRPPNTDAIERWGSPYFYNHQINLSKKGDQEALQSVKERCEPCSQPHVIEGIQRLQDGDMIKSTVAFWEALRKDPSNQLTRLYLVRNFVTQKKWQEAALIAKQGFKYPIEKSYQDYFNSIILKYEKMK